MATWSRTPNEAVLAYPFPWQAQLALHARTLYLFAALQLLDISTTGYGLSLGIVSEGNPLAASLLVYGLPVMLAAKAALVTAVACLVVRLSVHFKRIWRALWISNIFYVGVGAINLFSLLS